ncbi:MAG: hypothetical protein IPJ19_09515 [Planctomycetes bacterium]|nr:hypothetical protein [Planctomycetota bacterium]
MFHFERRPQTYANHGKIEPSYHFAAFGILLVNLGYGALQLWREPGFATGLQLALAVALVIVFFAMRVFALSVQDRVIRLEERLRLERLLPAELRGRIGEFTIGQLVALRFASDAELPGLARAVLEERLTDRRAIKQRIRDWRPDYDRC